jgi:hypothetical protein
VPLSLRGRHYLVGWITVFLAVAAVITLRDRAAFTTNERIAALEDSLRVLGRQHYDLTSRLVIRRTPAALSVVGERLGLKAPTDNEIERIQVPRR